MEFTWSVALVGLLVGFFVGLTGVGGGVILTPLLIAMGIKPTIAVGTDLVYGSITKLVGTYRNVKEERIDWNWTYTLALGSVPAGIAGTYFIQYLNVQYGNADEFIKHTLGFVLIVAAAVTLISEFYLKGKENKHLWDLTPTTWSKRAKVVGIGMAVGLLVGLTSVGSGSLIAMALILTSNLSMQKLVGTDIAHAMLLVTAAGMAHLDIGTVNLALATNLLVGSIPGILIGTRLAGIAPARPLKLGITTLVLVGGVKMI